MKYDLIIYHGDCYDGFTAAWVVRREGRNTPDAEFFPAKYGQGQRPDCAGKHVLMVDFSYDRKTMLAMNEEAASLVVLDHHKTAEANCEGLDFCEFDMGRSGCQMVWDYLTKSEGPRPWLVDSVADRDLWKFERRDTKRIHAQYSSVPMTFDFWQEMYDQGRDHAEGSGAAILRALERYCEKCGAHAYEGRLPGVDYPAVVLNVPYLNASEVAHYLLENSPWADISIGWFRRGDGRYQYSLRSRNDGPDVGEVAELFGGGGHAHASGFDQPSEIVLPGGGGRNA